MRLLTSGMHMAQVIKALEESLLWGFYLNTFTADLKSKAEE